MNRVNKVIRRSIIAIVLVLLVIGIPASAVFAAQGPFSATGTIEQISETYGFLAGSSGNFIVTSRTVAGTFVSGDLSGPYTMTYRANVDLYTQAGNMSGQLTNGPYVFAISGKSYPVTWTPDATSPIGVIGSSTADGTWQLPDGSGTFGSSFSFMPTAQGHIDYILPGSTFSMMGKWNAKNTP